MERFLESFLRFPLEQLPLIVVVLLIAFTVHEFAHAFTAYKLGDNTAKEQGRLTLNPIHHLDPLGTLLILIAGFGWARPVPVNRYHFKNPRIGGIFVSLMGPISNFILAILGTGIFYIFVVTGVAGSLHPLVIQFFNLFIYFNVLLFVFNLLPLPPLDGYRILEDLLPTKVRAKMTQYESFGSLIFIILVITPLGRYTIYPVINTAIPFFIESIQRIFSIFL
ncbi:site-2 protease family protein [Lederbergia galactosidilytica]|uniref:Zinc metalloprotease n=1 Tax=Lederbergia galactosidilytica TaxID=217031 RepID=A0A0Q9Y3B4_9BACI|nr:site-2 protease family protein [Lederbergia galactosidilytica]KRG11310.1 zinc metalloprotease [Lederbergia galactosidilytica]KRG15872.1 zinc metalloprotease [Virgibacillus soli]MBP1915564.1 Zn-dependent protease [Lederbergia galactosidilytica]OAK67522.1 zinc metalloprotease [Lederbergia galactosidilytica]